MLSQARIDRKSTVDPVEVIRSRGIELKKNCKGYKGSCSLHDDTDPSLSISPDQYRWNCFGCK